MKKSKIVGIVLSTILSLGVISTAAVVSARGEFIQQVEAVAPYTSGDGETYYNGVSDSLTGNSLVQALNALNTQKLQHRVGYGNMASSYRQTDYDPEKGKGSEFLLSFYSGKSAKYSGNMNREHTWPASRTVGGRGSDPLEDDIHMTRPTLTSENSSRGNSFFAESGAWDPASFNNPSYRGDSARIIFYCAIADTRLTIVDKTTDGASNHTMGKLSDLLKWNLEYPVLQREKNRNEGAEGLQGNRNPFIDHPEYACKIWGNTNDATRKICGSQGGGGGDSSSSDSSSSSSSLTPTPQDENLVTTPSVGTKYKLGFFNTVISRQYYIDGNSSSLVYGDTVETRDEAADVELINTDGGYNIRVTKANGSEVYLGAELSGTNGLIKFDSSAKAVWSWNSQYNTFITTINGSDYFAGAIQSNTVLGLYKKSTYISGSTVSHAHLYDDGSVTPGGGDDSSSGESYGSEGGDSSGQEQKKGGGGCSASINSGNSSLVFFTALGALFIAIRMRFKKKED